MSHALPKLLVFDLDDTLWYPEMYMLDGAPFTRDESGTVRDCSGTEVDLIGDTREILEMLRREPEWKHTRIAYASRTFYPERAAECLKLIEIEDVQWSGSDSGSSARTSMMELTELQEIYPGDKKDHFRKFAHKSGVEFKDMIFFDNEYRNVRSVSSLGVHSVYTPDGLTWDFFQTGVTQWQKARGHSPHYFGDD
ncbi:MAG: hypothetical protein MHM6MM_005318 [Cercozoa sp. M6MM]